jgi:hypothetical protein
MAYGSPPPAPPPGRQPGYGRQAPWQQQPPPGPYGPGPQAPPAYGLPGPQAPSRGQAPLGPPTQDEQTWALMAYLGQFLTSAIAPALVLVFKGGSPFVRRHARQGLNMAIGAVAVWVVGMLLIQLMDALAFIPLAYTGLMMFYLVRSAIGVNRGEYTPVPTFIAWPILK